MSDDTTVWQKVRRPRSPLPDDVEYDRRSNTHSGLPIWLVAVVTLVPLLSLTGTAFSAYVRRGAVLEQLIEQVEELEQSQRAQWERIGQHLTNHGE